MSMRLYSGLVESENPKVVIDRWSGGGILRNGALVFSMDRNPIIGCKSCRENLQLLKIRSGAVFLVKPNENVIRRNGKTLNLFERRVFVSPTKKCPPTLCLTSIRHRHRCQRPKIFFKLVSDFDSFAVSIKPFDL